MPNGNIGRAGRRGRVVLGITTGALALLIVLLLHRAGAGIWWRLLTLPLFWVSALGFLQAQASTCVVYAARGTCALDAGRAPHLEPDEIARDREQAKAIVRRTSLLAFVAIAIALLLR